MVPNYGGVAIIIEAKQFGLLNPLYTVGQILCIIVSLIKGYSSVVDAERVNIESSTH